MKNLGLLLLMLSAVFAFSQGTAPVVKSDIVKLTPSTRLEWNRNPEPDIAGYFVQMQSGAGIVQFFTTNNFVSVLTLNPTMQNGSHSFTVTAVNVAGLNSDPSATLTTNLFRPPGQASKPRAYNP